MSNKFLQSVACPNCGSPINLRGLSTSGSDVQCEACGGTFILQGHVCPYCGTYHEKATAFCRQCGSPLSRRCPKCETNNWIGDEYCVHCGAPLDIFELISQRYVVETSDRLYQQMEESQQVKQAEMAASDARLARMLAEEKEFNAALQRRRLEQKQQEQKVLMIVAGVAVVMLVLVVISLLTGVF